MRPPAFDVKLVEERNSCPAVIRESMGSCCVVNLEEKGSNVARREGFRRGGVGGRAARGEAFASESMTGASIQGNCLQTEWHGICRDCLSCLSEAFLLGKMEHPRLGFLYARRTLWQTVVYTNALWWVSVLSLCWVFIYR